MVDNIAIINDAMNFINKSITRIRIVHLAHVFTEKYTHIKLSEHVIKLAFFDLSTPA